MSNAFATCLWLRVHGVHVFLQLIAGGIADTILSRLERGEMQLAGDWLARLAVFYQTPPTALTSELKRWAIERGLIL